VILINKAFLEIDLPHVERNKIISQLNTKKYEVIGTIPCF